MICLVDLLAVALGWCRIGYWFRGLFGFGAVCDLVVIWVVCCGFVIGGGWVGTCVFSLLFVCLLLCLVVWVVDFGVVRPCSLICGLGFV